MMYFKAWGHWYQLLVVMVIFLIAQTCAEGTEVWLAWWTMDVSRKQLVSCKDDPNCQEREIAGPPISDLDNRPQVFWNWIYVGLALTSVFLTFARGYYFQTRGVIASRRMVKGLVGRVLGGTMSFFDVTPSGRILNRFSADTDRLDTQLTNIFENYLGISAWICGALLVVCVLLPWFTLPFVPLCLVYKEIVEGGENLSMGQRQLVALARVLLRKPRVLMLDEATASVDMETDAHIQNVIKDRILAQGESTLLVIAHRLSTVVDSSRVLVMEQGEAAEFSTPKELLSDKNTILSQMVDKMGPQAAAGLRAQCGIVT